MLIQNASIDSLASLVNLQKVTGNVTIKLTGLDSLVWLWNLDTIGGHLSISNNAQLVKLDGLDNLELVDDNLYVFNNQELSDCCAIEDLVNGQNGKEVSGTMSIYSNDTGCDNILEINASCGPMQMVAPLVGGQKSVHETFKLSDLKIYPNPTKGEITLFFPNEVLEAGEVRILDLQGKKLISHPLEPGLGKHVLSLEALSEGVYFIQVIENGMPVWFEKLVRQ